MKKRFLLILIATALASTPVAAAESADQDVTTAVDLQDADLNTDTGISVDYNKKKVKRVIKLIKKLPEEGDESFTEKVWAAYDAYEALSMAEKVQVTNADKLIEAKERAGERPENAVSEAESAGSAAEVGSSPESEVSNNPETIIDVNGTPVNGETPSSTGDDREHFGSEYIFMTTESERSLSITVRYTTDANGDGVTDIPDISLTSPSGTVTKIANGMRRLEDESISVAFTWEASFLQMDISFAEPGNWKLSTTNQVAFRSLPYAGPQQNIQSAELTPTPEPESDENALGVKDIIPLAAIVVLLAALIAMLLSSKKSKEKEAKRSKKKNIPRQMTDDEKIEIIRRNWEKKRKEEERREEEERKRLEKTKKEEDDIPTFDERLTVTIEDIEDDDAIEIIDSEQYSEKKNALEKDNDFFDFF